jgi:hypothetical protein
MYIFLILLLDKLKKNTERFGFSGKRKTAPQNGPIKAPQMFSNFTKYLFNQNKPSLFNPQLSEVFD